MSQPAEPNPPESKQPAPTPAEFGAGAFEGRPDREEPPTPSHDLAAPARVDRVALEASSLPPVIELPAPLAVRESYPVIAQAAASEVDPVIAQAAASEVDPVLAQAAASETNPMHAQADAPLTSVFAPLLIESEPVVAVPSQSAAMPGPIAPTPLVEPAETPRIIDPVLARAAASETDPMLAQAAAGEIDPVRAQAEGLATSVLAPLLVESEPVVAGPSQPAATPGPIAPAPLVEPAETPRIEEPVPAPAFVERPVLEAVLEIEARPRVLEVEAVPVSRFDAPAPTIDVEARRAPPPPPIHVPELVASQARDPIAAGSSAAHEPAATGAEAFAAAAASASAETPPPAAQQEHRDNSASRWWSMVCHLFLFLAIPTLFLGGFLTLLVWLLAGRNDALVTSNGREALNFQINVAILTALLAITCIASPLIPVVWFVAGVFCVLAAVRAFSGESYRYPYMFRIVRA